MTLLVIDDDMMSREVLTLLAEDAGLDVTACESGEEALAFLAAPAALASRRPPDAILTDIQMPGLSGDPLALALRHACGPATVLVAMSGSPVPPGLRTHYNAFLLKPFSIEDFTAVLDSTATPSASSSATHTPTDDALDPAIYASFARSLTPAQLAELYAMSLDDADRRIGLMHQALAHNDDDAYKRSAHSIKGGCGMVGALELARLAAFMEANGLQCVDSVDPLKEFLDASARLRRILNALQK